MLADHSNLLPPRSADCRRCHPSDPVDVSVASSARSVVAKIIPACARARVPFVYILRGLVGLLWLTPSHLTTDNLIIHPTDTNLNMFNITDTQSVCSVCKNRRSESYNRMLFSFHAHRDRRRSGRFWHFFPVPRRVAAVRQGTAGHRQRTDDYALNNRQLKRYLLISLVFLL